MSLDQLHDTSFVAVVVAPRASRPIASSMCPDLEVGEVEPGEWPARDRDGRGSNYAVVAPDPGTAREWFRRGAMCILSAGGRRFVGKASGFSLPNSAGGPAPLVYFVRWRDLPAADPAP